jgi:hypothetical protein
LRFARNFAISLVDDELVGVLVEQVDAAPSSTGDVVLARDDAEADAHHLVRAMGHARVRRDEDDDRRAGDHGIS